MTFFKHKYNHYSDEQLMQAIQVGNAAAFKVLYQRYSQRLLHFFCRLLGGDEEKAQDFLQDTFLKIVEKPHQFQIDKNFSTWIFTVAYNLCKNEYRRQDVRKQFQNVPDLDAFVHNNGGELQEVEQAIDQKLFEQALEKELAQFDPERRSIFLLRFQQNFSIKEISDILKCAEGTVKSRLFYMTQKLGRVLKAYNPNEFEVS